MPDNLTPPPLLPPMVNRTSPVNTMLCFANVAVSTNQNYQVVFPPSTQHATYHIQSEDSRPLPAIWTNPLLRRRSSVI